MDEIAGQKNIQFLNGQAFGMNRALIGTFKQSGDVNLCGSFQKRGAAPVNPHVRLYLEHDFSDQPQKRLVLNGSQTGLRNGVFFLLLVFFFLMQARKHSCLSYMRPVLLMRAWPDAQRPQINVVKWVVGVLDDDKRITVSDQELLPGSGLVSGVGRCHTERTLPLRRRGRTIVGGDEPCGFARGAPMLCHLHTKDPNHNPNPCVNTHLVPLCNQQ